MKLYKYLKPERINVVRDLRLRFTLPGFLDDPFECRVSFDLESFRSKFKDRDYSEDECTRDWRRYLSAEFGILCLTKKPDNLVMWAHYAAAHRGFLIELDSENEFFHRRYVWTIDWKWMDMMPLEAPGYGNLQDVYYMEQRPVSQDSNEILTDYLFVKSEDWAYEEEARMVLPLRDADIVVEKKNSPAEIHLFDFPPSALTSIILGAGFEDGLKEEMMKILKNDKLNHVKLLQAKIHSRDFKLEFFDI